MQGGTGTFVMALGGKLGSVNNIFKPSGLEASPALIKSSSGLLAKNKIHSLAWF